MPDPPCAAPLCYFRRAPGGGGAGRTLSRSRQLAIMIVRCTVTLYQYQFRHWVALLATPSAGLECSPGIADARILEGIFTFEWDTRTAWGWVLYWIGHWVQL